jgi:hypothetical protein
MEVIGSAYRVSLGSDEMLVYSQNCEYTKNHGIVHFK